MSPAGDDLEQLRQRIDALQLAVRAHDYEAVAIRRHVTELRASASWRITSAWRKVEGVLRHIWPLDQGRSRDGELSPGLLALQQTALRERSLLARDMLWALAAEGRAAPDLPVAARPEVVLDARVRACRRADATLALARVVADQRLLEGDAALAVALYRHHRDSFMSAGWQAGDHVCFIDLLEELGQGAQAAEQLRQLPQHAIADWDRACLEANLARASGDDADWLLPLNRLFIGSGLEPLVLAEGEEGAIDRLVCPAPMQEAAGQPLVSVLMPVYRPDAAVDTAIASVLAQTWRNLELLVVDDGSPDAEFSRLRHWPGRDQRVRLIRSGRNGGTYRARNRGLAEVRGEFITCHDADDWSHPRKIQLQVEHLLRNPHRIGNLSGWARTLPELRFQRFSMSGRLVYPNLSSLMFRRQAIAALGGWDEVRFGADNEFCKRLELVFRKRLDVVGSMPLAFGRVHQRSLTSATLGRGYVSFERRCYEAAWLRWHRQRVASGGQSRLANDGERPFRVPAAMLPERGGEAGRLSYDIVVVADYCRAGAMADHFAKRIRELAASGATLALCQVRALEASSLVHAHVSGPVQDVMEELALPLVQLDASIDCGRIHLLYPRVLEFTALCQICDIRGESATLECWEAVIEGQEDYPYPDEKLIEREALRLFGTAIRQVA